MQSAGPACLRFAKACHSTYTYGPLGLISRTQEFGDADPDNNRDHYYLSDAGGGNVGMLLDDDGDAATARQAVFQTFDAFGNNVKDAIGAGGSYARRGQEGSVTDRHSGLVHMQARHYDPTLGRFLQQDAVVRRQVP